MPLRGVKSVMWLPPNNHIMADCCRGNRYVAVLAQQAAVPSTRIAHAAGLILLPRHDPCTVAPAHELAAGRGPAPGARMRLYERP